MAAWSRYGPGDPAVEGAVHELDPLRDLGAIPAAPVLLVHRIELAACCPFWRLPGFDAATGRIPVGTVDWVRMARFGGIYTVDPRQPTSHNPLDPANSQVGAHWRFTPGGREVAEEARRG
jgi:hypothetical protein